MLYRALVGIKKVDSLTDGKKAEREAAQEQILHEQLKFWNSTAKVLPYYDPAYDTDRVYSDILRRNGKLDKGMNIDDPLEVMNYLGRGTGHVFYTSVPAEDKKVRDFKKREYERKKAKYEKNGEEMPAAEEARYLVEIREPEAAPRTHLYAYSTLNPNGMFTSYEYPITKSYIPDISDVEASKLLNRNYGTMHDIILLGDLDFEGTYLPNVVFRNDGEMLESYPNHDDNEPEPGGDPEEIRAFLEETLDRKDYVAIIECTA